MSLRHARETSSEASRRSRPEICLAKYLEEPFVREVDAVTHAASHDAINQASTRERIAVQRERGLDARPKSRPARFYRCTTLVSRQRLHAERISQAR